ncbi:MAG: hypothetical protein KME35_15545 [Aphanocapsa sp. GSE-SYN-MK-11-07L]|jgi:hypothetical protein|nr:hypothetical protein [Aphanocapsa sp. GSE-SYN-MK-11-07L]
MKNWEFLIQKEGDAEWLTLESPTVEILEGCYQVMAYSCLPSSMIKIQICHTFVENGVSQQRCHQRSQQSSPTGAIEVMPFAYLEPGLWTLACRLPPGSNLHTELPLLQLQVLPQVELCADWDIDPPQQDQSAEQSQTRQEEQNLPNIEDAVELVEQQTDQAAVIASLENALRNFSSEPVFEQFTPSLDFTDLYEAMGDIGSEVPFSQDMLEFLFQHLNDAVLSPEPSDLESDRDDLEILDLDLDLDNSSTNPSLQEPIFDSLELSPTLFDSPTQLSCLVILDQSAYTAIAGETIEIAGRVFAEGELVIRLRDPLTQVQLSEQIYILPQPNIPSSFSHLLTVPTEHRVLVGEAKLVTADQAHEIRSTQAFMITVIAATVASNLVVKDVEVIEPIELDNLVAEPILEPAPLPLEPQKPKSEPMLELPIIDATAGLVALQPASGPNLPPRLYPRQTPKKPVRSPALPQFLQRQPAERELVRTGSAKPTEAGYEALDLGKRFWSTLSTLAHQVDLVPSGSLEAAAPDLLSGVELPTFDRAAPLPIPTLILPERDLRAGLPLVVEVRLPDTEAQLCIKLWVIDQETEATIVPPRWLVDFSYNPRQEILETSTQLSLPSSSQEIAFKAIAVDMTSQQESPPLTIVRSLLSE